ncbi:MAG: hypothetical protein J5486_05595 [Bacteroidaceae bacterium]|nr:hypothetical protein [Bacteroidaceae bacterium]
MAKPLIPEELDALIQEYLTDGILTDKERAVILKKAEKLGLDIDEIDLYLDAQVQKIDQATDAAARKQKGKVCPFCGGSVPQLADKCPHCGENITAEASKELQEILDNLEEALIELKEGKDYKRNKAVVEKYARKAKLYYSNNPKIASLMSEIEAETLIAEKKAKKQVYFETYKQHAVLFTCIIVAILGLIGWGIYKGIDKAIAAPDVTDPIICQQAMNEAVEDGNLKKASEYLAIYMKANYHEDDDYEERSDAINGIQQALLELGLAYIEQGDIEKGLAIQEIFDNAGSFYTQEQMLKSAAQLKYIERGEFDKAEQCVYYGSYDFQEYYDFLCHCIDKMKDDGDIQKARNFIERKVSFYRQADSDEDYTATWGTSVVKQLLLDYLGS